MIVEVRKSVPPDVIAIVPQLRERDRDRLEQMGNPASIMLVGLDNSLFALTGLIDGQVVAIGGARVLSALDDRAYLWMIGSKQIDAHPLVFLRHSRMVARTLSMHFRQLYGDIECDYEKSVRWLKWLGAEIRQRDGQLVFSL